MPQVGETERRHGRQYVILGRTVLGTALLTMAGTVECPFVRLYASIAMAGAMGVISLVALTFASEMKGNPYLNPRVKNNPALMRSYYLESLPSLGTGLVVGLAVFAHIPTTPLAVITLAASAYCSVRFNRVGKRLVQEAAV